MGSLLQAWVQTCVPEPTLVKEWALDDLLPCCLWGTLALRTFDLTIILMMPLLVTVFPMEQQWGQSSCQSAEVTQLIGPELGSSQEPMNGFLPPCLLEKHSLL